MGITGLLPFVKSASKTCHLSEFKGKTVAVDAYCWLHKGAFGCAAKLAKGEQTDMYVQYCFKYIDMLSSFRIKPILVFDGRNLPAKADTERKRRQNRVLARKRAAECLKLGKTTEAFHQFRKCVDITPEMALTLIKECRKKRIDCIVAPYEADAQLAFLNQAKIANFIISEDSDLLTFGCDKVLFKLDLTGSGTLVDAELLYLAVGDRPDSFNFDKFRYMCILSGCDYLDSLPGIGLKKAHKFLKHTNVDDIYEALLKIPSKLNMSNLVVHQEYRNQFMIADATFRHQLIYDPVHRRMRPLTDPEECNTQPQYLCNAGDMLEEDVAFQLALGNLNPFTFEKMDTWSPDEALKSYVNPSNCIWNNTFETSFQSSITKKPVKVQFQSTKRKNITFDVEQLVDQEQSKKEYDDKLKEELNTYYLNTTKKHCPSSPKEEVLQPENNHVTSPVLSGRSSKINPFIKNLRSQRLSRFSRTVMDENICVQSRFFSKQNTEVKREETVEEVIEELPVHIENDEGSAEKNIILPKPNLDESHIEKKAQTDMKQVKKVLFQSNKNCASSDSKHSSPVKKKLKQPTLLSMFGR